ncbi:hypothetical protein V495_03146 [Pseudogymnoascus sp. VKM F-4514 (FW-929)]|nr:hypothetical protein V495_03146 [Pseudogymnoascus sp. VKM F-4514 (FW-929)]KFY59013.1 hypothetical protein V497_04557 [Pseudogymnoascus sp. VKM F-4516 (FW-969)]
MPPRYLGPGDSLLSYRVPSFTPVNQPVRSSWGRNSDALYDIPQDDDPLPVSQLPQKRKRSTASTRNKSAPTAQMKKPRRKGDSPLSKRPVYLAKPNEQALPPPSLSLGPKKSASRRTNSALSKQTKVFPNTSISKPNAQQSYDNEPHHKQTAEFTINTPSTLDRVAQAGHIGLARTTLEKLAAFRFKTSAADVELNQARLDRTTSWNQPTDTADLETHQFVDEQSTRKGVNNIYLEPALDDAVLPIEHEVYGDASHQASHIQAYGEPDADFDDLFDESAHISYSMEAPDAGNIYSSVCNDTSKQGHTATMKGSSSIYRDSAAVGVEVGDFSNLRGHAESPKAWDEGVDDDFDHVISDDPAVPNTLETPHILLQNTSVQFPVEHRSDDFDDGVDDDDLMEIMVEYENVHSYAKHQAVTPLSNSGEPSLEFENASQSSSRLQSTDDGYFMDDIDEAELANLAELDNPVIIETHSPPSNWTQSGVRSRDREIYDEKLNYSSPSIKCDDNIINKNQLRVQPSAESLAEPEDWAFLNHNFAVSKNIGFLHDETLPTSLLMTPGLPGRHSANDDSHEYTPLAPFARSPFPEKVSGVSLIPGLTTSTMLRTCFRIGECIRAGSFCHRLNQDVIIELFCRVTFSSRQNETHKQIFQFADIFHNGPPFVSGVLANYRVSALQERESKELLTGVREVPEMIERQRESPKDWKLSSNARYPQQLGQN